MIYFILHHLFDILPFTKDCKDVKKNCLTFLLGSIIHFIFYGMLKEYKLTGMLKVITDFYVYIVLVDAIAMGVLYKTYYGRSILNEVAAIDEDDWDYDDEQHRYKRKKEDFHDNEESEQSEQLDKDKNSNNNEVENEVENNDNEEEM